MRNILVVWEIVPLREYEAFSKDDKDRCKDWHVQLYPKGS